MQVQPHKPLLALTLGDPSGIGPEIVAAAVRDPRVRKACRVVVLGPRSSSPPELPEIDDVTRGSTFELAFLSTGEDRCSWEPGKPQASAGRAALWASRRGAELAEAGLVDALVTAPVSKEALHLAGEKVEGQSELFARWAGVDVRMLAVAGRLRVALLTRHLPLKEAISSLDQGEIVRALQELSDGLALLGIERPHLALAGLNPHAGEGGLLGSEESDFLIPAVQAANERGLRVSGPLPPDTLFQRAARGAFDAVLALYHDQAFIPVKLHAPDDAVTVLLGLPFLRVSPAHGTAFDIVGTGKASPENLIAAVLRAAEWVVQRGRRARQVSSSALPGVGVGDAGDR